MIGTHVKVQMMRMNVFYDAVSLVNSHDQPLSSLPYQVTETPCETNLNGLALGCRQPSKSDQASDLEEKACLHVAIQVPELNETYLCEGKQKIKNDVSQLKNIVQHDGKGDTC